ncbi:MAG: type I-E CRISPR-associated protein Cse2/CasB [Spirochaetaceae bacterium]|jgi:CRISPR system Cascade subunit CasB|nr:type I-E CRISPR-associated protein Cse2/CasB [Spirochaetaceae bacterium]
MSTENKEERRADRFVKTVIERLRDDVNDSAFGAALRRADNPDTEYQSWKYLVQWCDLEQIRERKAFVLIGAALAKAKPQGNGVFGIGQALAQCYADEGKNNGSEKDAANAKIRRLLACTSTEEACDILRPLLSLIHSREVSLNYAGLLNDILYTDSGFNEWIKPRWAKDFYRYGEAKEEEKKAKKDKK